MEEKPLVRIVDDDPLQCEALGFMLQGMGYETRAFSDARSFLKEDSPSRPGVVILDLQMPGMDGLSLQRELAARGARIPIIFLSAHGDLRKAVEAMKMGSVDFLEKPVDGPRLLGLLEETLRADRFCRIAGVSAKAARFSLNSLSEREMCVVKLISEGIPKREIALRLGLSLKTVNTHAQTIKHKLGFQPFEGMLSLLEGA